jgi:potassium voltage-gated channel Eag-related subfamily H protein 7
MIILALLFTAIVTPYEVSMLATQMNTRFIVNCFVDLIYLADMVRHSFLAFKHRTTGELIVDNGAIFGRYCRGWFLLDFITIVPFDAITLLTQNKDLTRAKSIKGLRLLRLLKLTKVIRASMLFVQYEAKLMGMVSYAQINLFGNCWKILIICHWFACGWIMAAMFVCDEVCMRNIYDMNVGVTPMDVFIYPPGDETWLVEELRRMMIQNNIYLGTADRYKAAIYWAATTLTSVGYGDIHAFNSTEQVVGFFFLLVSGLVWASIIADICQIAATLDINKIEFRRTVDQVNYMMGEWTIPDPMQEKVRAFFFQSSELQRTLRYNQIMGQISPTLRAELLSEVPWWVRLSGEIIYFKSSGQKKAGSAFLGEVVGKITPSVLVAGESVGQPATLVLLQKGVVLRHGKVKHPDSYWGEDLILHNPALRESHHAITFTYVALRSLTRADLLQVLTCFPEVRQWGGVGERCVL